MGFFEDAELFFKNMFEIIDKVVKIVLDVFSLIPYAFDLSVEFLFIIIEVFDWFIDSIIPIIMGKEGESGFIDRLFDFFSYVLGLVTDNSTVFYFAFSLIPAYFILNLEIQAINKIHN